MMADADGKRANPVYLGHNLDIDVTEESINHENECKITKDPYIEAVEYLEKKKILDVFQALTAQIIYERPEKPLEFILKELQEKKKSFSSRS